jgi:integrase
VTRYEREVSAHKKGAQPKEDRRRMELWERFLGSTRPVIAIDFTTIDRFVRDRRAGRIQLLDAKGEPRKFKAGPSDATVGADIVFLVSALNWATNVQLTDGSRLLEQNPLRGYEIPRNKNPRRPVATYDRYLAVREHADDVDPQRLFGSFMDLIEALGGRVSAVCELRASDYDRATSSVAPFGRLRKRGEFDKVGVDMRVPLSEVARNALERVRQTNPVVGEMPLFRAPKAVVGDRPAAWSRHHARKLLGRAERAAGLEALAGGDFHPYRRAWATERKHLPRADVAAAGGWRDVRALELCYQRTDEATMLAVVTEPRKLREAKQ